MAWRVSVLTNVQLGLQLQLPLPPPVVTTQAMCGQHSSGLRDAREAIKSLSLLDSAGTQRCPHSPPEGGQCPPLAMRGGGGEMARSVCHVRACVSVPHPAPTLDSLTEAPEQGLAPGGGCGGANAEQAHPHNLSPKLGQALQAGINSSA